MNEELWTRAQTALDERRELSSLPDELGELRAALEALEGADNPLRAPRRIRPAPAAAAALALLALGVWFAFPSHTAAEELELHPIVARPELGRVHSWELVSSCVTSEGASAMRAGEGSLAYESQPRAPSTTAAVVLAILEERSVSQ